MARQTYEDKVIRIYQGHESGIFDEQEYKKHLADLKAEFGKPVIQVSAAGRTDLKEYFSISGLFSYSKLKHTPFLVFLQDEAGGDVRIVDEPKRLLFYPDDTPVMGQWRGEWRSDFFQFTVGQYRAYLETGEVPERSEGQ